jgi:hypothetical protein
MNGLTPGLGSVSGSPDPLWTHVVVVFVWGMLLLFVFMDLTLGVGS